MRAYVVQQQSITTTKQTDRQTDRQSDRQTCLIV